MDLLKQLREVNRERCKSFGHTVESMSLSFWSNAVAGETGEMCNLIKKMERGDSISIMSIENEMADIIIYLDLLAAKLDIDLREAIICKFNMISSKMDSEIILY